MQITGNIAQHASFSLTSAGAREAKPEARPEPQMEFAPEPKEAPKSGGADSSRFTALRSRVEDVFARIQNDGGRHHEANVQHRDPVRPDHQVEQDDDHGRAERAEGHERPIVRRGLRAIQRAVRDELASVRGDLEPGQLRDVQHARRDFRNELRDLRNDFQHDELGRGELVEGARGAFENFVGTLRDVFGVPEEPSAPNAPGAPGGSGDLVVNDQLSSDPSVVVIDPEVATPAEPDVIQPDPLVLTPQVGSPLDAGPVAFGEPVSTPSDPQGAFRDLIATLTSSFESSISDLQSFLEDAVTEADQAEEDASGGFRLDVSIYTEMSFSLSAPGAGSQLDLAG